AFADKRARAALGAQVQVGKILHPSPASPLANRGWGPAAAAELRGLGLCPVADPVPGACVKERVLKDGLGASGRASARWLAFSFFCFKNWASFLASGTPRAKTRARRRARVGYAGARSRARACANGRSMWR